MLVELFVLLLSSCLFFLLLHDCPVQLDVRSGVSQPVDHCKRGLDLNLFLNWLNKADYYNKFNI